MSATGVGFNQSTMVEEAECISVIEKKLIMRDPGECPFVNASSLVTSCMVHGIECQITSVYGTCSRPNSKVEEYSSDS